MLFPFAGKGRGNIHGAADADRHHCPVGLSLRRVCKQGEIPFSGVCCGYVFANKIGLSTQMPFVQEIVSNEMGNPIKRLDYNGRTFIVRKSRCKINEENVYTLQFLELLKDIETYSELPKEETKNKLSEYIFSKSITKEKVDNYLSLFPDKIYKSIYEMGLSNVFA